MTRMKKSVIALKTGLAILIVGVLFCASILDGWMPDAFFAFFDRTTATTHSSFAHIRAAVLCAQIGMIIAFVGFCLTLGGVVALFVQRASITVTTGRVSR